MGNVAKGKGKTRGKNGKTGKCAQNPQTAFKIMIIGDRQSFCVKADTFLSKRKLILNYSPNFSK